MILPKIRYTDSTDWSCSDKSPFLQYYNWEALPPYVGWPTKTTIHWTIILPTFITVKVQAASVLLPRSTVTLSMPWLVIT